METYRQLTQEQRVPIYALKKARQNQAEIARVVGVDKSTISRELKRNSGKRGFRPKQAQRIAPLQGSEGTRYSRSRETRAQRGSRAHKFTISGRGQLGDAERN